MKLRSVCIILKLLQEGQHNLLHQQPFSTALQTVVNKSSCALIGCLTLDYELSVGGGCSGAVDD